MKTPLEQIAKDLAPILGTKGYAENAIQIPDPLNTSPQLTHETAKTARNDRILTLIEAALDRLEHGTFGLCVKCGVEISLSRLDQDPSVSQCRGCDREQTATLR
ncbi:MAG: hypothetical protein Hens3KO_29100 [Henriciella sp.]